MLTSEQMAVRIARELQGAATVHLDEGLPRLLATQLPEGTRLVDAPSAGTQVDVAVVVAREVATSGAFVADRKPCDASKLIAVLEHHHAEDGSSYVVAECRQPASGNAQQVITPLALFDVRPEGLVMREVAPGVSARDVQLQSGAPLLAADDLKVIQL